MLERAFLTATDGSLAPESRRDRADSPIKPRVGGGAEPSAVSQPSNAGDWRTSEARSPGARALEINARGVTRSAPLRIVVTAALPRSFKSLRAAALDLFDRLVGPQADPRAFEYVYVRINRNRRRP